MHPSQRSRATRELLSELSCDLKTRIDARLTAEFAAANAREEEKRAAAREVEHNLLKHWFADQWNSSWGDDTYDKCARDVRGLGFSKIPSDRDYCNLYPHGGFLVSENHDRTYQEIILGLNFDESNEKDEEALLKFYYKPLRALKGIHVSPHLQCVSSKHGIVSVSLTAAKTFFETYFDMPLNFAKPTDKCDTPFNFQNIDGRFMDDVSEGLSRYRTLSCRRAALPRDPPPLKSPNQTFKNAGAILRETLEDSRKSLIARARKKEIEDATSIIGQATLAGPERGVADWDNGILNYDIQRLLRRGGVFLETGPVLGKVREILKEYATNLIRDAKMICETKRSTIVTVDDVISSKPCGITLLGYGGAYGVRNVWSDHIIIVLRQVRPELTIDYVALSILNDITTFFLSRYHRESKRITKYADTN